MEKNGIFMTIMTLVVAVIVMGTFALPVINNVNTVEVTEEHEGVYGSNPVQQTDLYATAESGYLFFKNDSSWKTTSITFSVDEPTISAEDEKYGSYSEPVKVCDGEYLTALPALDLFSLYISTDGVNYSSASSVEFSSTYNLEFETVDPSTLGLPNYTDFEDSRYPIKFTNVPDTISIALLTQSRFNYTAALGTSYPDAQAYRCTSAYRPYSYLGLNGSDLVFGSDTVTPGATIYGAMSEGSTTPDSSSIAPLNFEYSDSKWLFEGSAITSISGVSNTYSLITVATGAQYSVNTLQMPVETEYSPTSGLYLLLDASQVNFCAYNTIQAYLTGGSISLLEDVTTIPGATYNTLSLTSDLPYQYSVISTNGIYPQEVSIPSDMKVLAKNPFECRITATYVFPDSILTGTATSVKGDLVDGQFVESENGSLLKIPSQILTEGTTYNVGADQTYYFGTSDSTTLIENKAPESADVPDTDKPTFTVNSANAGVYDMTFGTDVQGDAFIIIAATCIYNYAETHNEELNPLLGVVAVMLCIGLICMAVAAWSGRENL